ncbi:MAG: class I SAM-dependent methyltransferase [Candidatus Thorarchaeota archaeon]
MKNIDYDAVSKVYDKVRTGDSEMVGQITRGISLSPNSLVLDVGCGTANNTLLFSEATGLPIVGIDFSLGMLSKAIEKVPAIGFLQAPAEELPFHDDCFEFAYMTEVLHLLSDFKKVIFEIYRVLQKRGQLCIVTQSHDQIANRMTSRFFPATRSIDQSRYPSIPSLETSLTNAGFTTIESRIYRFAPVRLGQGFLETIERRGFSMLHKIGEEAYNSGLERIKAALSDGEQLDYSAGYTFVWATK